jgi:predicted nucleic acid-binding protein
LRYLIDTCVISEIVRKAPEKKVVDWIQAQDESALFLSVITIGEIQKGISKLPEGRRRRRLQSWLGDDLPRRFIGRILEIDPEIASRWGMISGDAERRGARIPVLDGLLAATALETGMILVTRNTAHARAAGAQVQDPWTS